MLAAGPTGIHVARMGVVVSCLLASACLVPPPLEQVGPAENNPPRILLQNLEPGPTRQPTVLPAACPEIRTFGASLLDPDGDTIYWRVFVDYWADLDRRPEPQETPTIANTAEPIEFTIDGPFSELNPHIIELYIADRPFREGLFDQEGRVLEDPLEGQVDSFVWPITLDPLRDPLCPEP